MLVCTLCVSVSVLAAVVVCVCVGVCQPFLNPLGEQCHLK